MGNPRPIALILAALLAIAASAAPASAQAPLDSPGRVDRIESVASTTTADGFNWDLYRNLAYPCSVSGYQTFAVATRNGSSLTAPRPLWVRMRGGGVGFFAPDGSPQPSAKNKTESDLDELIGFVEENPLNQLVNADPAGFRTVSVSMCNHDIYGGGDQADPNNFGVTPDGATRTVNGLFATKAAIRFVQERYPTTKTFLHGTSAGSFGSFGVAYSLGLEDRPVAGFVADSGVLNQQYELDQNAAGGTCARGPEALAAVSARLHPVLADPANQPDLLIARGDLSAPVFNVWNREDANSCGTEQIPCTMPDRSVVVMGAMECKLDRVSKAIAALPASRNSVTARLCVRSNNGPAGSCTRHVVTNANTTDFPNTDPSFPADYNGAILSWVRARLEDTSPALEVSLGKPKRLRVEHRRTDVRCISGGSGSRTCKMVLDARFGKRLRVVARGTGSLTAGEGSKKVRVKLTGFGRRKLAALEPRRELRVRAHASVTELYTDRAGAAERTLRLR